jgi:hypothetical protein
MIGMALSRIEDAFQEMLDALNGYPLFTMTQAKRLIGYLGDYASNDWSDRALHTVAKNAYRLREQGEPGARVRHRRRREIVYARTKADRRRWRPADKAMIIAQLDRTDKALRAVDKSTSRRCSRSRKKMKIDIRCVHAGGYSVHVD